MRNPMQAFTMQELKVLPDPNKRKVWLQIGKEGCARPPATRHGQPNSMRTRKGAKPHRNPNANVRKRNRHLTAKV